MNGYEWHAHRCEHRFQVNSWETRKFPYFSKSSQQTQRGNLLSTGRLYVYTLNPFIILILLVGCIFEIAYCKLLKVTHWRILLSGVVKACGPVAAVFAVDSNPRLDFLLLHHY